MHCRYIKQNGEAKNKERKDTKSANQTLKRITVMGIENEERHWIRLTAEG